MHFESVKVVKTKSTDVLKGCSKKIYNIVSTNGKDGWSHVLNVKGST